MLVKYRPDIDGLRAIAVSAVVLFHAFPHALPGGFVGVDIFFVISGYLISSILLAEINNGELSVRRFYERRIRRIFPALVVVLLVTGAAGYALLFSSEFRTLGEHVIGSAFFVENFVLWRESGYFDTESLSKPLLHLWSLAVEEQYYLFWPLLLLALRNCRWAIPVAIGTIVLASFSYSTYLVFTDATAAYYSPLSRVWELMAGAFLAYLMQSVGPARKYPNLLAVSGFAAILAGFTIIDEGSHFPGPWALLPVGGCFLIIAAGPVAWLNRTLLANRLAVSLGLISYPLYLWHWPVFAYLHILQVFKQPAVKLIAICACVALATATYRFVEIPLRTAAPARRRRPTGIALACAMASLAVVATSVLWLGLDARLGESNLPKESSWSFIRKTFEISNNNLTGVYDINPSRQNHSLFIGDSHVAQYAERLSTLSEMHQNINSPKMYLGAGCVMIPGVFTDNSVRLPCWPLREEAWKAAADDASSPVIIGGAWNYYFSNKQYYLIEGERRYELTTPQGRKLALSKLEDGLRNLSSKQRPVYLLLGNPSSTAFNPRLLIDRVFGSPPQATAHFDRKQLDLYSDLIATAKRAGASVIDPRQPICTDDVCHTWTKDGMPIFMDSSHFNPDWVKRNGNFVDVTLRDVSTGP